MVLSEVKCDKAINDMTTQFSYVLVRTRDSFQPEPLGKGQKEL